MSLTDALTRLIRVYRRDGLRDGTRKLLSFAKAKLLDRSPLCLLRVSSGDRQELRRMLGGSFDRVIVWRSGFGFQVPLYQRPQQMARQLARLGCLVVYEAGRCPDGVEKFRRQKENLLLFNFSNRALRRLLMREIDRLNKPKYLQIYSTNYEMPLSELERWIRRGYGLIYEYVDHLSPEISGTRELPAAIRDKFRYAMTHPEAYVVVTAELLKRDVLARRGGKRLIESSNGVDLSFFRRWEDYSFEPAFRAILSRGKPIVCYYGALACWLDYDLLREIASCGAYSLVLIGVKYDASFDASAPRGENVFFLGPKDYRVLKYYAREADVLILPFLVNELTRSTNPVKLFEYMALRRPIVSTDVDECRRYPGVLIGKDRAAFMKQLERALTLRGDESYLSLLDRGAAENDWKNKAQALIDGLRRE